MTAMTQFALRTNKRAKKFRFDWELCNVAKPRQSLQPLHIQCNCQCQFDIYERYTKRIHTYYYVLQSNLLNTVFSNALQNTDRIARSTQVVSLRQNKVSSRCKMQYVVALNVDCTITGRCTNLGVILHLCFRVGNTFYRYKHHQQFPDDS